MKKKSNHAGLAQQNGFAPACFCTLAKVGEKAHSKAVRLLEKSVINMV
jgi:hypothetical protein